MIFAKRKDANVYKGIHPNLDWALTLLQDEFFLQMVGSETNLLEGEAFYVTRFDYETIPFEDTFYEAHKKYLDIHMLTKGTERVDIASPDSLVSVFSQGDFYKYQGEAEQTVVLRPDNFLVVFPGDAHRIKIQTNKPEKVSKVVFKILF